jgi:hypothetical protein
MATADGVYQKGVDSDVPKSDPDRIVRLGAHLCLFGSD